MLDVILIPALVLLAYLAFWLACRLGARRCPRCGSKWRTECIGEWDGIEDWRCWSCDMTWGVGYWANKESRADMNPNANEGE